MPPVGVQTVIVSSINENILKMHFYLNITQLFE